MRPFVSLDCLSDEEWSVRCLHNGEILFHGWTV